MSIVIDKEFESLIPPLTEDEFAQLEENCMKDGIRDPLVVWNQDGDDILVDGHNRFRIVGKHPTLQFNIKRMEFADRDKAKIWIIHNQLGRRNIHDLDRNALLLEEEKLVAQENKKKMSPGTNQYTKRSVENFPPSTKTKTRDIMGAKMGVSGKQFDKLKVINQKGSTEVKQQVRDGVLSVNQAYRDVLGIPRTPPKVNLTKEAEKRHEQFEQAKEEKTVDIQAAISDKDDVVTIARSMALEIESSMTKMLNVKRLGSVDVDNIRKVERTKESKDNFRRQLRDCIKLLIHLERVLNDW